MRSTFAATSAALLVLAGLLACAPGSSGARCTRIAIDPGHDARGNLDPERIGPGSPHRKIKDAGGTSGVVSGAPESVGNLRIAVRLRKLLRAEGCCVRM